MNIRLATIEDADSLARLNQEFNGGDQLTASAIIESLKNNNEWVAVASINDKVIGFACAQSFKSFCYHEPHGEITEMYVKGSARRNGAATSLISFLENKLLLSGVKTVKILTGRANKAAIRTYELSGYVMDDELLLIKKL